MFSVEGYLDVNLGHDLRLNDITTVLPRSEYAEDVDRYVDSDGCILRLLTR